MFNFLKKQTQEDSDSQILTLQITDMHCSSCAMNIDMTLEDLPGVKKATTKFASSQTTVEFDANQTSTTQIIQAISALGYTTQVR
jgi:Cu+-exporting ATPase